jgi:hypothetical protein
MANKKETISENTKETKSAEVEETVKEEVNESDKKVDGNEDAAVNSFLETYGEKLSAAEAIGRATLNFEILNALVGFPMDFLDGISDQINELTRLIDNINGSNKRKVSIKVTDATNLRDGVIKFAFRLEGLRAAVLDDLQPDYGAAKEEDKAPTNEAKVPEMGDINGAEGKEESK